MAKAIEKWNDRVDKFVDEMLAEGLGEEAIDQLIARMSSRFCAAMKGEAAPM